MPRKKRLSAKAVRRLRKVQERILEEPRRANMAIGIARRDRSGQAVLLDGYRSTIVVAEWPPCGTVGCIAGHICLAARRLPATWPSQSAQAARLIEYDGQKRADAIELFHQTFWPDILRTRLLQQRPGTVAYAQVIAAAIDAWIAGGGSFDAPA